MFMDALKLIVAPFGMWGMAAYVHMHQSEKSTRKCKIDDLADIEE